MSDVIGFLESLGAGRLADGDYRSAVADLEVGDVAREALLRRDATALNALLGGRAAMWCAIMTPEESPDDDAPRRDEPTREEPQPDPDKD